MTGASTTKPHLGLTSTWSYSSAHAGLLEVRDDGVHLGIVVGHGVRVAGVEDGPVDAGRRI